ncbi:Stk1 family PASTA domain-containing Ser/Thr kinase [Pseudoramibacter sp.]|uniref:Stk1 family PASTA domain-containing Ser/Thr kinase n=1 Tax=Pseudoramibacter sp. TaxID=2034862 RepID=UPI0025CF4C5F|nr:Stk1 family PASTA domain-containing Ser/Thr kinase [Pseudoramibacter sp.]MCH4071957.1 Stk1 family PASTA domain-containing Ser/Thr kinase [Pseudoramibacter sp.]MCH4105725.1 Stk1 family PASTA domain-containing Ser/Thr kinase [Pseudoramibacter sp.]
MIGKVLNNRYKIIELIGRGGMAYVYKAQDLKLNRYVAVKILREEYTENEQFIKKFDRESQAAAGLSDPNIVSVYDVGVDGDVYFIVMEYVDGITLKQYLTQKGRLDYEEATNFIIDIAEALKCAHEHGIIHRDIKPQNIMLTSDLTPKVTDFGIARAITSATITMTNQTMGSVHYISPEQARGGYVDARSDLYSLGIMYYELLTGELPFDDDNSVSIAIKHIQEDITPPNEINPDIPQSVSDVVVRLCQKKPEDRYQNCEELIEDLDQIMLDASVSPVGETASTADLFKDENPLQEDITGINDLRKKKRNRKIALIVALIAAALIGVVAYAMTRQKVTVPDLTGMTESQATAACKQLGLSLEVSDHDYSDSVGKGKIMSQTPKANSQVAKGRAIRVTISKGKNSTTVPSVVGLTESAAVSKLEDADLTVSEVKREYNDKYDSGIVYAVSPNAGSSVSKNGKVVLYVSKGQNTASVPGVVGLTQSDAESRIKANGFSVGSVTSQNSDSYAKGVVISQSPSEGSSASKGSSINFVISSGPAQQTTDDSSDDNNNGGQGTQTQDQSQNQNSNSQSQSHT